MSFLKFNLLHALGAVFGVLIPGASAQTANDTHSVQQTIAEVFGAAALKMANELKLDTTGMSGPDKCFAIVRALVATAKAQGFKGDLKVLEAAVVDVAAAAYRASEPSFGADILALAAVFHVGPALTSVAELIAPVVQHVADAHMPKADETSATLASAPTAQAE